MDILIWGCGLNAIKFVKLNKEINIIGFIDSNKDKDVFFGKKVYLPCQAEQLIKRSYIVVACSESVYFEIKRELNSYGLKEFENYVYWEIYGKKNIVIYGNCHIIPIKEILRLSPEFNERFGFYPFKPVYEFKINNEQLTDDHMIAIKNCDVFIHQSIRDNNTYGKEFASSNFVKHLKKECKIISFPNLYRQPKCFYPQVVAHETESYNNEVSMFPFRDKYIEEEYLNGTSIERIVKIIQDPDLISSNELQMELDKFWTKIECREIEWDIKIMEFLKNSYKKKQLFYDPNHPTNELFIYIAKEICRILDIDISKINMQAYILGGYTMDRLEIPIYETVKKAYGLEFSNSVMRTHSRWGLNSSQMNLYSYVEQYIKWYY